MPSVKRNPKERLLFDLYVELAQNINFTLEDLQIQYPDINIAPLGSLIMTMMARTMVNHHPYFEKNVIPGELVNGAILQVILSKHFHVNKSDEETITNKLLLLEKEYEKQLNDHLKSNTNYLEAVIIVTVTMFSEFTQVKYGASLCNSFIELFNSNISSLDDFSKEIIKFDK